MYSGAIYFESDLSVYSPLVYIAAKASQFLWVKSRMPFSAICRCYPENDKMPLYSCFPHVYVTFHKKVKDDIPHKMNKSFGTDIV